MLKRALVFGLLAAAGGAVWTLGEFALGLHTTDLETGRYTGFGALVFPILGIVLAIRAGRRARGGRSTFTQAFADGAGVTVVQALAGAAFFQAYFTAINPGFFDALAAAGQKSSASEQVVILLVSSLIAGLIISAIAAAVMRTRPAAQQSEQLPR